MCLLSMEQVGRQPSLASVWHGSVVCLLDQPEPGQDKPSIGSKEVTESMYNEDLVEPISQKSNCRQLLPTALPEA